VGEFLLVPAHPGTPGQCIYNHGRLAFTGWHSSVPLWKFNLSEYLVSISVLVLEKRQS